MLEGKFRTKFHDYRSFANFLDNSFRNDKEFINPVNFFLLEKGRVEERFLKDNYLDTFLKGRKIDLPVFEIVDPELHKFDRFEEYTAINEVDNISAWLLSFFDYFICCLNMDDCRLGKELEILQSSKPRDGRLDVATKIKQDILFFESKTTLKSALSDKRFSYQISDYLKEGNKCIKSKDRNLTFNGFLVLGGEESDIYPPEHPDCISGKVGDSSKIFYDKINKEGIKFISANFLWYLLNYSFVNGLRIDIFELLKKESSKNGFAGFLSGGSVINNTVNEINLSDYISS